MLAFVTARFTAANLITICRLEIASIFTRGLLFRSTSNARPRTPSGEIPWKQFLNSIDGMIGDAGQYVTRISFRIKIVEFGQTNKL
jgi:hypothetical protein